MADKLPAAAQECRRQSNGHELVAEVLDGVTYEGGMRVPDERPAPMDEKVAA